MDVRDTDEKVTSWRSEDLSETSLKWRRVKDCYNLAARNDPNGRRPLPTAVTRRLSQEADRGGEPAWAEYRSGSSV